jgi:putative transcriptional regulator
LFNLYTVKVETAGFGGATSSSGGIIKPEGYIPGIKDPNKLEKITQRLIHEYTQEVPEKIKSQVFTNNVLMYDEFIAYLLTRMAEVEEIKTKVKELRNKVGITQDDLAKDVGVSRQTIISLEQGKYVPSLTLAMKIARIFNVSVEKIFELDENDYSKKKGKTVI